MRARFDGGMFVGMAVAMVAIVGGTLMEGGHLESLLGVPAFIIVAGGTLGAVIVQFPFKTVGDSMRAVKHLIRKPNRDARSLVDEIVDLAQLARKEGILGLEQAGTTASDPLLQKGIMMAIDGCDSAVIRSALETAIELSEERAENSAKVWEAAGGYSPTIGIIGAVIGLIHVMGDLSDINAVGEGVAAAFVATIYGVALANIVYIPLGGRIKVVHQEESRFMELIVTGVLAIQEGLNPKLVRERLAPYISAHKEKKGAAKKEAEGAEAGSANAAQGA